MADAEQRSHGGTAIQERPAGALDLHEDFSEPPRPGTGCERCPARLRLASVTTGELVRGRCHATNLCGYCAKLGAVENAEMLALDALAGRAPELWAVLTTRTATVATAPFYEARRAIVRALRRRDRWPGAEVACLVEFTTGYGEKSGGK